MEEVYRVKPYKNIGEMMKKLSQDENLEEIMCIGPGRPWKVYHRTMGMLDTDVVLDEKGIEKVLEWLSKSSRRKLKGEFMMDMRLPNGARVNVVMPPIAIEGPYITIRLFPTNPLSILDLIKKGTITPEAAGYLWMIIDGFDVKPANILIAGGTGTGKTTLLNALSFFIPPDKRIITIEDTAELNLPHPHWLRMEVPLHITPPVDMDALLKNALRMRPERLIIGEVRGEEAKTLFSAMNIGHEGCMGTLHANSSMDTVSRITSPPMSVPRKMLEALDAILLMATFFKEEGAKRVLAEVTEISGVEEKGVRMNPIMKLDPVNLTIRPTGVPSSLRDKISRAVGIKPTKFNEELKRRIKILEALAKEDLGSREAFYKIHESLNRDLEAIAKKPSEQEPQQDPESMG
jgi:flagellar protein FlaI